MNRFVFYILLVGAGLPLGARAADEAPTKTNVSDAIRARLNEDAKQGKTRPAGPTKTQAAAEAAQPAPPPTPPTPAPATPVSTEEAAKAREQAPTVLDPVEVRKRKMTEFENQLQKQEAEIIREKKNTKATELDKALNDSTVSKALAIFGGKSNEHRASVASERVSLMEEEKDLIEAINHAKTKEEKRDLQKQLDELKKVRRELEKSLK
jgi:hypothetical protein